MRSKRTNKSMGKGLAATILDSYQEYCQLGYPNDPKIYVINADFETLQKVESTLNKGIIPKSPTEKNWGFQTRVDASLRPGEVVFGPEQVRIVWDGK